MRDHGDGFEELRVEPSGRAVSVGGVRRRVGGLAAPGGGAALGRDEVVDDYG